MLRVPGQDLHAIPRDDIERSRAVDRAASATERRQSELEPTRKRFDAERGRLPVRARSATDAAGSIPAARDRGAQRVTLGGPKYSEFEIEPGPPITPLVYGARLVLESAIRRGSTGVVKGGGCKPSAQPAQVRILPPPSLAPSRRSTSASWRQRSANQPDRRIIRARVRGSDGCSRRATQGVSQPAEVPIGRRSRTTTGRREAARRCEAVCALAAESVAHPSIASSTLSLAESATSFDLAGGLVDLALVLEVIVAGQVAGGFLDAALGVVRVPSVSSVHRFPSWSRYARVPMTRLTARERATNAAPTETGRPGGRGGPFRALCEKQTGRPGGLAARLGLDGLLREFPSRVSRSRTPHSVVCPPTLTPKHPKFRNFASCECPSPIGRRTPGRLDSGQLRAAAAPRAAA